MNVHVSCVFLTRKVVANYFKYSTLWVFQWEGSSSLGTIIGIAQDEDLLQAALASTSSDHITALETPGDSWQGVIYTNIIKYFLPGAGAIVKQFTYRKAHQHFYIFYRSIIILIDSKQREGCFAQQMTADWTKLQCLCRHD